MAALAALCLATPVLAPCIPTAMLEEALRASSFESEPPRSPPPKHLLEGVRAAFIKQAASIQAGAHCKSRKGKDRWKVVDALVAGENLSFGVVAEGLGGVEVVDWCVSNIPALVIEVLHNSQTEPTGKAISEAAKDVFCLAHHKCRGEVATDGRSGCYLTMCVVNRSRHEVTACSLGAASAILLSGKNCTKILTRNHRIEMHEREQQRLRKHGATLAHALDERKRPLGPLRAWPGGLTCARAIGIVACGELVSPIPSCTTVACHPSGGDVIIGSDGVWDELLVSRVAALARASPSAATAAKLVVESAALQHQPYYAEDAHTTPYGTPRDDATVVVMRVGREAHTPTRLSYAEARSANKLRPAADGTCTNSSSSSTNSSTNSSTATATPLAIASGMTTPSDASLHRGRQPSSRAAAPVQPVDLFAGIDVREVGLRPARHAAPLEACPSALEPMGAARPAPTTSTPPGAGKGADGPRAQPPGHRSQPSQQHTQRQEEKHGSCVVS